MLQVKVQLLDGAQKAFRFTGDILVQECMKQLEEKIGGFSAKETLLWLEVPTTPTQEKWRRPLRKERTLNFYDVKSGDLLVLTKNAMPLKIRLIDGTTKTVLMSPIATPYEATEIIAEKLGIRNHEEYSLARIEDTSRITERMQPLIVEQSLWENGVKENEHLTLTVAD